MSTREAGSPRLLNVAFQAAFDCLVARRVETSKGSSAPLERKTIVFLVAEAVVEVFVPASQRGRCGGEEMLTPYAWFVGSIRP
ncbi:unnamed protein product [Lampetra fluviatilis]